MGNLTSLFSKKTDGSLGKVVRQLKMGLYRVRMDNVEYAMNCLDPSIKSLRPGDTVLVNTTGLGRFHIMGKTEGLSKPNSTVKEVRRDG